jgi:hypothetical protein
MSGDTGKRLDTKATLAKAEPNIPTTGAADGAVPDPVGVNKAHGPAEDAVQAAKPDQIAQEQAAAAEQQNRALNTQERADLAENQQVRDSMHTPTNFGASESVVNQPDEPPAPVKGESADRDYADVVGRAVQLSGVVPERLFPGVEFTITDEAPTADDRIKAAEEFESAVQKDNDKLAEGMGRQFANSVMSMGYGIKVGATTTRRTASK